MLYFRAWEKVKLKTFYRKIIPLYILVLEDSRENVYSPSCNQPQCDVVAGHYIPYTPLSPTTVYYIKMEEHHHYTAHQIKSVTYGSCCLSLLLMFMLLSFMG